MYNEKFAGKGLEDELKASHILVKTEAEAKEIKAKLDKGEDFEKLAKEKSIDPGSKVTGGDLGYFAPSQMVPEFSKAAFALKNGEISQPVKSQFGWHIIKAFDKRKQKPVSYKDALPALEQEFASEVIEAKATELRNSAKIEYKVKLPGVATAKPAKPVVKTNINQPKPVPAPVAAKPATPAVAPAPKAAEPKPVEKK
jgi:parvulin-like peptidyl-prolyl isomerase